MTKPMSQVAHQLALEVAERHGTVATLRRFPTGLCHYVFDVELCSGERFVVRVAEPGNRHLLEGAVAWQARLRPLGVPLAAVREYNVSDAAPLPYLVLDRLPGDDLGEVYPGLTTASRRQIALAIADLQLAVGTMGVADGYGYSHNPTRRPPRRSWADVVLGNLRRSGGRLRRADASVRELHAGVERLAQAHESALTAVPATPFLDDLTTKNVIVQAGRLTGIVDVDVVCFGDPLYTPALTKVALVARDAPTDYVDVWLERLAPDQASLKLFDLYCAVFCLDLLSEAGQMFNSDRATVVQPEQTERLSALAGELTVC